MFKRVFHWFKNTAHIIPLCFKSQAESSYKGKFKIRIKVSGFVSVLRLEY